MKFRLKCIASDKHSHCSLPEDDSATCIASLLVFASRRRRLSPDEDFAIVVFRHHVKPSLLAGA